MEQLFVEPALFQDMPPWVHHDMHLAYLAVDLRPDNFHHCAVELRTQPLFQRFALLKDPSILCAMPMTFQRDFNEVLDLVAIKAETVQHILPMHLSKEHVSMILQKNPMALPFVQARRRELKGFDLEQLLGDVHLPPHPA